MAKADNVRKHTGGGPRPDFTGLKRKEAAERLRSWTKLTPEAQLKALDRRPGESKRQRARLAALIEKRKHQPKQEPKAPATAAVTEEGGRIKAKERRAAEQAKRALR